MEYKILIQAFGFLAELYNKLSRVALLREAMQSKKSLQMNYLVRMHGALASDFEGVIWTYFLDEYWPGQMLWRRVLSLAALKETGWNNHRNDHKQELLKPVGCTAYSFERLFM